MWYATYRGLGEPVALYICVRWAMRSETEFLHDVVDTVYSMLNPKQLHVPETLLGTDAQVQEINSWFDQPDARVLSIYGMAGSGKTTLANCIVNSVQRNFENITILEDIRNRCRATQDLAQLQIYLRKDIFGDRKRNILCDGITYVLEDVLQRKKALIVLDDIADEDQLVALLGNGNINEQSKRIITTRDDSINKWLCSRPWRCQVYAFRAFYRVLVYKDHKSPFLMSGGKLVDGYGTMLTVQKQETSKD